MCVLVIFMYGYIDVIYVSIYILFFKRFVVKVDWKFLKFEEYEEGIDVEIFVDVKFF